MVSIQLARLSDSTRWLTHQPPNSLRLESIHVYRGMLSPSRRSAVVHWKPVGGNTQYGFDRVVTTNYAKPLWHTEMCIAVPSTDIGAVGTYIYCSTFSDSRRSDVVHSKPAASNTQYGFDRVKLHGDYQMCRIIVAPRIAHGAADRR